MCIAPPNLTQWLVQLAVKNSWLLSFLTSLVKEMVHGSLLLATAPQRFPEDGCGSCASPAGECGFVMVDSVLERGAAAPGRCRHRFVQDWQPTRTGFAPTHLQMGLSGYVASPAHVFSAPARGIRNEDLLPDRVQSPRQGAFPLNNVLRKRCR